MRSSWKRNIFIYIAIILAGVALFSYLLPATSKPEEISLDEVIAMSQANEIQKMEIEEDKLIVTTNSDKEFETFIGNLNYVDLQELGLSLSKVDYSVKSSGINWGGATKADS